MWRCCHDGHVFRNFWTTLPASIRDDDALSLQIASDGSVESLRYLLDQLQRESIAVEGLSVHTPDLEDVFFALTSSTKDGVPV